ncbi:MAG TPA: peptide chain release factor N(5)-glutamine methyltransferase [Ilumatobacteraceae bacterium]|nr:peptide chain release factor N(5)-glutamine methyltransferase [Ilumatobacteraceae bacterium]
MSDDAISWGELWNETAARVGRPQARWLCEVASGLDGDEFLVSLDAAATARAVAHLDAMLVRLDAGEPLQYVLGRWGFRHLDLMVDRRVLIPRPETELVVEVALRLARSLEHPIVCADLGTGSGAIGLSLAHELPLPGVVVWMTDQSSDALDVARANAAGIGRSGANVRLAHGVWFDALPVDLCGRLALVVSNPPYVSVDDDELEPVVRDWEPALALFGGEDGLDEIRRIVGDSARWLRPGGWLVIEIGSSHGRAVAELLRESGFDEIAITPDLSGHDRVAVGRRGQR